MANSFDDVPSGWVRGSRTPLDLILYLTPLSVAWQGGAATGQLTLVGSAAASEGASLG